MNLVFDADDSPWEKNSRLLPYDHDLQVALGLRQVCTAARTRLERA